MQISASASPLLPTRLSPPPGTEVRGNLAQEDIVGVPFPPAPDSLGESGAAESVESVEPGSDIRVSTEARSASLANAPAAVYAEIWIGNVKVAQVDIHGQVISLSGLVPAGGGATLGGAMVAAQRAIQVAQQVGGEIRSAGQSFDGQSLLMRARLAETYGQGAQGLRSGVLS